MGHRIGSRTALALALAAAWQGGPAWAQDAAPPPPAPVRRSSESLERQFENPPPSARPRVWWHWMNGNVTKEGIARDLAWMKRVGIGGFQHFDVQLQTPQVVEQRLVYMTPEWKDAFRFAASEADRLGLEMAVAASPGWSETGGPWVAPADCMKKLVWAETGIVGGAPFAGPLAAPPAVTGPFQANARPAGIGEMLAGGTAAPAPSYYADVAVLAFPVEDAPPLPLPQLALPDGSAADAALLADNDAATAIAIKPASDGRAAALALTFDAPQTIRSATLFAPASASLFVGVAVSPRLEASDDGQAWRTVAELPAGAVPTTASFAPVTSSRFRLVLAPRPRPAGALGAAAPGADTSALDRWRAFGGGAFLLAELRLSGEPRVDRFEAKAGFAIEPDYAALSAGIGEAAGVEPGSVIDLTARMKPDGTLEWTPPAGRWRVLRLGTSLLGTANHPAPPEATGLEVDKFDGAAVRRYLETYLGMIRGAAGSDLVGRRGVQAILTDSIEVGAANWTPRMLARFKALRGYDPLPWLPALTGTIIGSRERSDRFLYDYRRTLADLLADEHYATIARVARERNLRVYGEALESGRPSLGDDMAMRRHADIPMAAMWTHSRAEGPQLSHIADIRGAASVAHVYGQPLVAAESLTSALAPWGHGPADLKRVIDLEFVNGINRPVIHASVHQPVDDKVPGLSLFIFGQYFNRHDAWAELARPWVDYVARNSLMLQQGRNVADLAYFYGEEAPLTALFEHKAISDAPAQYGWDFIGAHALANAMINHGDELVTQGGARYRAIYLGGTSRWMTLPLLRRLAALVEGGATVIGMAPQANPSLAGDAAEHAALVARLWGGGTDSRVGLGRVIATADAEAALARIGVAPDFRFTGGQPGSRIPFVHRKLADGDSWFLVNQQDRTETIEARFRVTGKAPELWRAETGESEPLGYRTENGETVVPLTLLADEAVHVVFRKAAAAPALAIKKVVPVERARLDGPWTVSFQPGRGAPPSAVLPVLAPLNEHADPAIRHFSGIATYAQDFKPPKGWKPGQPLWLDLGEAREVAEVVVNGKPAGYAWHAPYRVGIGALLRKGKNRLEVRVANLWVNRLIGDAQPGAQKITWTAMPAYRPDAPLRRSGLIGPAVLLGR